MSSSDSAPAPESAGKPAGKPDPKLAAAAKAAAIKPEQVLDWADYPDRLVVVTTGGQKIRVPK